MSQAAYFVIDVKVTDPEGMKPYQARVAETIKPFGGERLVYGGALDVLEGQGPNGLVVIVRFPSMAQAHAWHDSPAYQAIIGHRLASSESHAYLVQGEA